MNRPFEKMVRQLAANKTRLSLVIVLVVLTLLMWGRLMLKKLPRNVIARPAAAAASPAGATPSLTVVPSTRDDTVYVDLPDRLGRDLFDLDVQAYRRVPEPVEVPARGGKSLFELADDRLTVAGRVRAAARDLVLQTTVLGDQPRAMISGEFLEVGQRINGLELRKVTDREVVLTQDGVEVRLGM